MKSRRVERKKSRKEKKAKRNTFNLNKSKKIGQKQTDDQQLDQMVPKEEKKSPKKNIKIMKNKKIESKPKLSFKQKKDIEKEDKEIKRLEKLLKLNRRKKKGKLVTTLPKSFEAEGLGYILDVIGSHDKDSDKHYQSEKSDMDVQQESDKDNHDDDDDVDCDVEEYSPDSDEDEVFDEDHDAGGNANIKDVSDSNYSSDSNCSDDETDNVKEVSGLKQDIYGFLRDKSGNIVKPEIDSKNKPNKIVEENGFSEQILRRIRGSLNRLTVNNMVTICGQIKELYEQNSRHGVSQALLKCINNSVIDLNYVTPQKMKTELALLVALLHHGVGEEVGAHIIHRSICKFDELVKQIETNDSKIIDNLVLFIINLYVCGVIEAKLIFELMDKLCENFTEKSIELINLILRSIGFVLRKDNATKMKEFIMKIQNEAKQVDKSSLSGARIGFLLDSLIAIKNNNITKLKGYGSEVDLQVIESTLKNAIKRHRVNSIAGTYEAILQSAHWFSYTQNIEPISSNRNKTKETERETLENTMNDKLIKNLRLNTPLRKAIVVALSTCDDYIDASNRLITIGQKQFSEVINVLLHVCVHEKQFNPFYSHLFNHLSKCDRKYKVCIYSSDLF